MIRYTRGNILESDAEALVNTVNTVGVMGKGVALMFKETFRDNYDEYVEACKRGDVKIGRMLVVERRQLVGPKWIINFPTKKHWRHSSKMDWIEEGLIDLKNVIASRNIKSIAIPPLGSGSGGLDWKDVRSKIESALGSISDVDIIVYEPTKEYQNVAKRGGVEKLTPARALISELVRRYWIIGIECTILEIHKMAYFLERCIERRNIADALSLQFSANKFGPYSPRLMHLLNALDGSYLHCHKRLADASPMDVIWFDDSKQARLKAYLSAPEAKIYKVALDDAELVIEGFQSPLGLELLATVDWLVHRAKIAPTVASITAGLQDWPGGDAAVARKAKLLDERLIRLALQHLQRNLGSDADEHR